MELEIETVLNEIFSKCFCCIWISKLQMRFIVYSYLFFHEQKLQVTIIAYFRISSLLVPEPTWRRTSNYPELLCTGHWTLDKDPNVLLKLGSTNRRCNKINIKEIHFVTLYNHNFEWLLGTFLLPIFCSAIP